MSLKFKCGDFIRLKRFSALENVFHHSEERYWIYARVKSTSLGPANIYPRSTLIQAVLLEHISMSGCSAGAEVTLDFTYNYHGYLKDTPISFCKIRRATQSEVKAYMQAKRKEILASIAAKKKHLSEFETFANATTTGIRQFNKFKPGEIDRDWPKKVAKILRGQKS